MIEIDKIIRFFDHIYENLNIYHTLIIHSENSSINILELKMILGEKDYPICIFNNNKKLDILENKFRMFILDINIFNNYIKYKNNDLNTITIIFCLDTQVYIKVCDLFKLNTMINFADNLYIFSPNTI